MANYNAPGQVVIAGSPDGVEAATAGAARTSGPRRSAGRGQRRLPHAVHGPGPRPAARRAGRGRPAASRAAGRRQRRRPPPRRRRRLADAARRAAVQPGALAPDAPHTSRSRRHAPSSSSARARCSRGMAKRTVSAGCRTLDVATPDDLDRLLETLAAPAADAVGIHEGEHLFATERVVVSPAPGVFRPADGVGPGRALEAGRRARPGRQRRGAIPVRRDDHGHARRRRRAGRRPAAHRLAAGRLMTAVECGASHHRLGHARSPTRSSPTPTSRRTLDTTDEWIVERTGIRERRIGGHHRVAGRRGRRARRWHSAGLDRRRHRRRARLATTTPDQHVPATSALVQDAARHPRRRLRPQRRLLGVRLRAGGGIGLVATGLRPGAADRLGDAAAITDWDDRGDRDPVRRRRRRGRARGRRRTRATCSPATSAATASTPPPALRRPRRLHADGGPRGVPPGRARRWSSRPSDAWSGPGVTVDDIALLVPHQANIRIIDAAAERLGIDRRPDRHRARPHRQHVAASIPLALVDAADERPAPRRRPRAARRVRRRHDRGPAPLRPLAPATGRRPRRPMSRVVLVTGGSRGIGLACAAGASPRRATASPSPTAARHRPRPTPTACSACTCDVTDAGAGRRRVHRRSRPSSARSRCSWPTPASPATCSCCG